MKRRVREVLMVIVLLSTCIGVGYSKRGFVEKEMVEIRFVVANKEGRIAKLFIPAYWSKYKIEKYIDNLNEKIRFLDQDMNEIESKIIRMGFFKIYVMIPKGMEDRVELGDKCFLEVDKILQNRKEYLELKKEIKDKMKNRRYSKKKIEALFEEAKEGIENKSYVKAVKIYRTIIETSRDEDIIAKAYYYLANVFCFEFHKIEVNNLNDVDNCRMILKEMMAKIKGKSKWKDRANWLLSENYENACWETKNKKKYEYLKKSGVYGEVFLGLGRNYLTPLETDSILFTEGGDNQVFSIQMLQQMEGYRTDINVYDQKGNIFDAIYGDLRKTKNIDQVRISNTAYIIKNMTIPKDTLIRSFRSRKEASIKKTGKIYFTWIPEWFDEVNRLFEENGEGTYHFEKIGVVYELVKDVEKSKSRYLANKYYKNYGNPKDWPNYPFLLREFVHSVFWSKIDDFEKEEKWDELDGLYREVARIGHDGLSVLHNLGLKYSELARKMSERGKKGKEKEYLIKSDKYIRRAIELYPGSFVTYGLLIQQLVRDMLEHPENEKNNIKELDELYVEIKRNMGKSELAIKKVSGSDGRKSKEISYKNHPSWKQLGALEMYYKQFVQMPGVQLAQMKTMLNTQIADPKAVINENLALNTLVYLYQRGATIQYTPLVNDFFNLYEKLIPRMKKSYMFNLQLYQFSWQNLRRTQGVERLKLANGLLKLAENLANIGLQKEHVEFYFSFGEIASLLGKDSAALGYYKKFIAEMDKDSVARIKNSKVINTTIDKIKALEAKFEKVKSN